MSERTVLGLFAGTADQTCERVVPQRHPAGTVDEGNRLIDRLHHLEMTTFALAPAEGDAVKPAGKIDGNQRQSGDVPGGANHRFDQRDGETGSDDAGNQPRHLGERVGRTDTSSHLSA